MDETSRKEEEEGPVQLLRKEKGIRRPGTVVVDVNNPRRVYGRDVIREMCTME